MGPRLVVLKRGEHGVILFSNNSFFAIPAYLMESIFDPTGAGDTFAGGVMGYLAKCKNMTDANLRRAVVLGNIMATFAVEDFSLRRLGAIKRADVMRRFKRFRKQMHF
jgi:sugar/nucleoside kinase (ribokinase family)